MVQHPLQPCLAHRSRAHSTTGHEPIDSRCHGADTVSASSFSWSGGLLNRLRATCLAANRRVATVPPLLGSQFIAWRSMVGEAFITLPLSHCSPL